MKKVIVLICTAFALGVSGFPAAEEKPVPAKTPTPQQMKMKDCNREAGEKQLKGDERKKFMSGCLSGGARTESAQAADANPECAAKAVGGDGKRLAGAARASFMKKCMREVQAARRQ